MSDPFTSRCEGLVRERPRLLLLMFGFVTIVAAYLASQISIDTSVGTLLVESEKKDRNLLIKEEFSNDELLVIALEPPDRWTTADLRKLRDLGNRIERIPGVAEVVSLANIEDIRADGDSLDASPLQRSRGFRCRSFTKFSA